MSDTGIDDTGIGLRHWKALAASVAVAAVGYFIFSLWGGWRDVLAALDNIGFSGMGILLGLSVLNYLTRFVRWQCLLGALGHRVPAGTSLQIYIAGFALTTTPGKAGEALRSVFLKRHGIPIKRSMAAFVSERLSDLLAVVLLSCWGVQSFPQIRMVVLASTVLLLAVFVLVSQGRLLNDWRARVGEPASRSARLAGHALDILSEAARLHRPRTLALSTGLSVFAWACEAWAFHLLLGMLGAQQPLTFAVFVYAIGMLAGALSFMPGGLGGTEAAMLSLLLLHGVAQPVAVVAILVIRITTLWYAVLLGLTSLLRLIHAPPSLQRRA